MSRELFFWVCFPPIHVSLLPFVYASFLCLIQAQSTLPSSAKKVCNSNRPAPSRSSRARRTKILKLHHLLLQARPVLQQGRCDQCASRSAKATFAKLPFLTGQIVPLPNEANEGGKLTSRFDLITDGHEELFVKDLTDDGRWDYDDLRARNLPNSTSAHSAFLATPGVAIPGSDEKIAGVGDVGDPGDVRQGGCSCWGCPIGMESWMDIQ